MSKLVLKALKAEKSKQQSKPLWCAAGKCFDRDLAVALRSVPKSEWRYFDAKLPLATLQAEQTLPPSHRRTLIIDLEDTLVSSIALEQEGFIVASKRPGCEQFLEEISKHYELVLWLTCPDRANAVEVIGSKQLFSHKLHQVADLSKIGRSLDELLVLTASEHRELSSYPLNVITMPKYVADSRHEEDGQFRFVEKVLVDLGRSQSDLRYSVQFLKSQKVFQSILSGKPLPNYTLPQGMSGVIRLEVEKQKIDLSVSEPYVPPARDGKRTVVLDLDETLVSTMRVSTTGSRSVHLVSKRPGVDEFLSRMSKLHELVLWTSSWQEYADAVVDKVLDPNGVLFSHRLYEQHLVAGKKDLSKLGRPIGEVMVVDDTEWRFTEEDRKIAKFVFVSKYLAFDGPVPDDMELFGLLPRSD